MPRDVSLSDSKCWNGGQKLVKVFLLRGLYDPLDVQFDYHFVFAKARV